MSPQRLLKCYTYRDPAELVMWNMLGACVNRQCKHVQGYPEPSPREMESLRGNLSFGRKA